MPRRTLLSADRPRTGAARVAAVLVPALLLTACTGEDGTEGPTPAASPVPSQGRPDLSGLPVPRGEVCDLLSEDDAARALGAPVETTAHYTNGDEVRVAPGVVDVSHEYGCVFEAADGTVARLWIFARPVTKGEARTLVRRASGEPDCAFPDTVVFGQPGLTSVCEVPAAGAEGNAAFRARFEGLFGADTWLGCEVSDPAERASASSATSPGPSGTDPPGKAHLLERSERWCTDAVTTVSAVS